MLYSAIQCTLESTNLQALMASLMNMAPLEFANSQDLVPMSWYLWVIDGWLSML
jgi:hypothetical protein